jgi:hypothetical protein
MTPGCIWLLVLVSSILAIGWGVVCCLFGLLLDPPGVALVLFGLLLMLLGVMNLVSSLRNAGQKKPTDSPWA